MEKPGQTATTWEAGPWNVNASHRYSEPGIGAVYGGKTKMTGVAVVKHYDDKFGYDTADRKHKYKDVELDDVLDLTDPKIRHAMGVSLDDLTATGPGQYNVTHEIGRLAEEFGFKAILAPPAKNASGATLLYLEVSKVSETMVFPEGKGFELDYDNYERNPNRKFSTSEELWNAFASTGADEWERCTFKEELLAEVNNDLDLAMVINHFVCEEYLSWLDRKDISDLGGLSPKECIQSEYGIKRLRMLFMQSK